MSILPKSFLWWFIPLLGLGQLWVCRGWFPPPPPWSVLLALLSTGVGAAGLMFLGLTKIFSWLSK